MGALDLIYRKDVRILLISGLKTGLKRTRASRLCSSQDGEGCMSSSGWAEAGDYDSL